MSYTGRANPAFLILVLVLHINIDIYTSKGPSPHFSILPLLFAASLLLALLWRLWSFEVVAMSSDK